MRIGVPKEIKTHEYRVGLTPAGVRELVSHGHEVVVERGAAAGIGIADDAYAPPAPRSLAGAAAVFAAAEHDRQGEGAAADRDRPAARRTRCCSPTCTSPPTGRRPRG